MKFVYVYFSVIFEFGNFSVMLEFEGYHCGEEWSLNDF